MNMTFHKICATVKEISVHNGNKHVHQALFPDGTASNRQKEKKKLTSVTEYMYKVESFHQFSSWILQNVCPDRQTDSVDQDQTAQTVQSDPDVVFTLSVNLWDIFLSNI